MIYFSSVACCITDNVSFAPVIFWMYISTFSNAL